MLRRENELFPQQAYVTSDNPEATSGETDAFSFWKFVPTRSINLCRPKNLRCIANDLLSNQPILILVIGSGSQAMDLLKYFDPHQVTLVFCDIATSGDLDVYCDAHELPFENEQFDGLITTAVMEHVVYPEVVANEITRVVKLGGFVYSEIPFLQSVHMGAYDFTRYTLGGHRRLYQAFEEVSAGMVAGAGTTLVWSLQGFFRSMFRSRRAAKASAQVARLMFFWLKYFDFWFQANPAATDFASATYFYGRKSQTPTSTIEIIRGYGK